METNQTTTTHKDMGDIMLVHSTAAAPFIITTDETPCTIPITTTSYFKLITQPKNIKPIQKELLQGTHFVYEHNPKAKQYCYQMCLQNLLTGENTFLYAKPLL